MVSIFQTPRNHRMKRTSLIAFLLLCSAVTATAQTVVVTLKSGKRFEGKLIEKTDSYVLLETEGVNVTFWKEEVENISTVENHSEQKKAPSFVTISGNIIFNGYQKGPIRIAAFDSPDKETRKAVAIAVIASPGPYVLKIAGDANVKAVFVGCYNDIDSDGPPRTKHDPFGWYGGNEERKQSFLLDQEEIRHIDIVLEPPQ